jgi:hypothetical protein
MKKHLKFSISILLISIFCSVIHNPNNTFSLNQNFNYISRNEWGADENLRIYKEDNPEAKIIKLPSDFYIRFAPETKLRKIVKTNKEGEKYTWPLQYSDKISKIVIHHTATTKNLDNPKKAIQDIYYFHTISRGWGDIGYNYIIDKEGNVYEGRYGGDGVVGAHAGAGNRGSIGIAVLGNYNEEELSEASYNALVALIAEKTKLYNIDPEGVSYFRGKKLPNIIGHGHLAATACPGKNIIKLLPKIRKDVAKINGVYPYKEKQKNLKYDFEYINKLEEIKMPPDSYIKYKIKLKNTGTKTWGSKTNLIFVSNPVLKKGFSIKTLPMEENSVKPGATGTFPVIIHSKLNGGFYYLSFQLSVDQGNILEKELNIPTIIENPHFAYKLIKISLPKSSLNIGEKTIGIVTLQNTGNVAWRNYGQNRISLGTDNPQDRISPFTKSNRMGYLKEHIVKPGGYAHFIFNLKAPEESGFYEEYFSPVIEGITWLDGRGMKFNFKVNQAKKNNTIGKK